MTSTASQRLRLDKQATGDNPDAWGERLNGVIDLVDEAAGFAEIAVNGNVTLSAQNFVSDQARRFVLRFTGAGGFSVTIPAVEKSYFIDNRCAADVTLKTASTPGSPVVAGTKRIAYCDGATVTTDTSSTAPPASAISVTPTGSIASTNVQSAIAELDGDVNNRVRFDVPQALSGDQKALAASNIGLNVATPFYSSGSGNSDFPGNNTYYAVASVNFRATGRNALLQGSVWFFHQVSATIQLLAYVDLFDATVGVNVLGGAEQRVNLSGTNAIGSLSPSFCFAGLTIGNTYTARLWVQRATVAGPTQISAPSIGGLNI